MKIRTRFTILFTVIVGVILFFFSFSIYYLSENYRQNDFHSRLQERAIAKLKFLLITNEETGKLLYNSIEEDHLHSLINENIVIYDKNRKLIYRDTTAPLPSIKVFNSIKSEIAYSYFEGGVEYIGFLYPFKGDTYLLFASATDKHGTSYISNLKNTLIARGFILMLIIFLSGWLYAGRFLKPISNIVQQTDKISYSNLNQRLHAGNPTDEIGQLTATFNRMLERLETSFKIQKRFVSNASHELRNPLTAISGQIDVALLKDREKEEYRKVLQSVSVDIKGLRILSNNLLELATSEVETIFQNFEEIRVDEILWNIRDEMAKQKPEYIVHINFGRLMDNEKFLTCKGEEKLLKTAFINIIDNACKFSDNKTVEIKVTFEKANIILFFADKGIGMPESYLKHIFEPFYRGSNTHGIFGSGIGLSLVQRVVKLHSGKIFIRSQLNEGTTVEVVLPNLS